MSLRPRKQSTYGKDRELRLLWRDVRESGLHFGVAVTALVGAAIFQSEVGEWLASGLLLLALARGVYATFKRRRVLSLIQGETDGARVRPACAEDVKSIVGLDEVWLADDPEAVIP